MSIETFYRSRGYGFLIFWVVATSAAFTAMAIRADPQVEDVITVTEEDEYRTELTEIVNSRLAERGITLEGGGEEALNAFISVGAKELAVGEPTTSQLREARENSRSLADAIAKEASPRSYATRQDVSNVTAGICPLYPFC